MEAEKFISSELFIFCAKNVNRHVLSYQKFYNLQLFGKAISQLTAAALIQPLELFIAVAIYVHVYPV